MTITPTESHKAQGPEMPAHAHMVHFSEDDISLINAVSAFLSAGLRAGEACIVVATGSHRESLWQQLQGEGLDLTLSQAAGSYISLDAGETLARFMVDGEPELARFREVLGLLIEQAAQGSRRVRIFGEMVALLWAQGNRFGAIHLEDLWNDLARTHVFSLYCTYSMKDFAGHEAQFLRISDQHSQIVAPESYTQLTEQERLRAFALLQQKAHTLEIEIAERQAAQARLRALAAIVETSDDAIYSKDIDGIITSWNSAAERIYGYSAEEMIGQSVTLLFPPDGQGEFEQIMARLRRGERVAHHITRRVRKDGDVLTVSVTISPVKDETGTIIGASSIARDITALEQRKDAFIGMASHELKTPVTSLKGFLSLVQRLLPQQANPRVIHYLTRMDAQIEKLITLINDLLDLSRIQTGQLVYRKERVALDALVQDIVETVQETTQTHHLLVEGQTHADVFGDRDRLGQVLINLLNNAIKYSPSADRVIVRLSADGQQVLVSVQDFGRGIAKAHHQKIFERFYQVTDPEDKTFPGLGIGLAICRDIVKRHGGRLWVESEKGAGASFHLSLPVLQRDSQPPASGDGVDEAP